MECPQKCLTFWGSVYEYLYCLIKSFICLTLYQFFRTLQFYDSATSVTPISKSQVVTSGYYYVSHTQLGCESQRSRIYIDVTPKPALPTGSLNQLFVDRGTVVDLKMNEPVIAWYPTYTDAVNNTNMLPANTMLVDKTTYYAVQVGVNNCYSDPVAVMVTIVLDTAVFDLIGLEYYPNPITSDFTIKSNDAIESITVFDNTGKRLLYKEYHQNIIKVDFSSFNSGQFMVRVQTSKGAQFIKVIKK